MIVHGDQLELLAHSSLSDQRRPLGIRALKLAAEPERARRILVHMPDRQLVQFWRQLMFLDQVAADAVDEDERRLHGCDIQLGAPEIRMCLDAAIGDGQRAPVAEQQHFVRVHAMRGEFADAVEAAGRVVDADHAGRVFEVILGGVEQRAVW